MLTLIRKFAKDDSGATAIEYGLLAALIAVAALAAMRGLGTTLNGVFTEVNTELNTP